MNEKPGGPRLEKFAIVVFLLIIIGTGAAAYLLGEHRTKEKWITVYGENGEDFALSVTAAHDEGYIIAGETRSFGAGVARDAFLAKIDALGSVLWLKISGGSASESGHSVAKTSDGGYVVAGWTSSFGSGSDDVYLVKTNSAGENLWAKSHGGSGTDWGESVALAENGGYMVAGRTTSFGAGSNDFYLIKTDSAGENLWSKTYGGTADEWAFSLNATSDGGYIIGGHTSSYGAGRDDFYLVKVDASGGVLWENTYGGENNDRCFSVVQTSDGGYIATGYTSSFGAGSEDVYLVKTDNSGAVTWTKTYGSTYFDRGYSVSQTDDGGYVIAGYLSPRGTGTRDAYLIRTNSSGEAIWVKTFGGAGLDRFYSVTQTSDGGFIAAGGTFSSGAGQSDIYLVKADSSGLAA
ncbi:MAG: hypothetical protein AB1476_05970 [Candidatus Hadarchaeota archaeon]